MNTTLNREVSKSSIITNMIWKFSERMGSQVVSLIVTIFLARLLSPDEYGLIAMATVFIAIANEFVISGFGNALIQKKDADKDADNLDFSSIFLLNIGLSIVLYGIVFVSVPYIARFYGYEMIPVRKPHRITK